MVKVSVWGGKGGERVAECQRPETGGCATRYPDGRGFQLNNPIGALKPEGSLEVGVKVGFLDVL